MSQKDKELLLKDLCARLPYGVKVQYDNGIYNIDYISELYEEIKLDIPDNYTIGISEIKPYLRPLSSITEEEKKEFHHIASLQHNYIGDDIFYTHWNMLDWLNAHHFDYRGLIPMDLAIKVTEENNPYK